MTNTVATKKAILVHHLALDAARKADEAQALYIKYLEAVKEATNAHTAYQEALYAFDGCWDEEPKGLCSEINEASSSYITHMKACRAI